MKFKILLSATLLCIQSISLARVIMILPNGASSTPTSTVDFLREESRNNKDEESLAMTYSNFFADSYFTKKPLYSSKHKAIDPQFIKNMQNMHDACLTYRLFDEEARKETRKETRKEIIKEKTKETSTLIYDVSDTCIQQTLPQQQITLTYNDWNESWWITSIRDLNASESYFYINNKADVQNFYNQFIMSLRMQDSSTTIDKYFSKRYLSSEPKQFSSDFTQPKCNKFSLNNINISSDTTANLDYTIYSMCDQNALPLMRSALLKRSSKGWTIDSIVERSVPKAYKNQEIDNIFAEYLAIDSYDKFVNLVVKGKPSVAQKRYLSANYLKNLQTNSNTSITKKEYEQFIGQPLQCQQYNPIYHTHNGIKQRVYYGITNKCNGSKSRIGYTRVDFMHHKNKWLIDDIQFFPINPKK